MFKSSLATVVFETCLVLAAVVALVVYVLRMGRRIDRFIEAERKERET